MFDHSPVIKPTIKFITVLFFHTPKENDSYYRPLVATIDDDVENDFNLMTGGGADLTPGTLSKIASRIIKPSPAAEGIVTIDQGWQSGRFAFFIEAEVTKGGAIYRETYQGFTDFMGATNINGQAHADPGMRLTINNRSVLQVRKTSAIQLEYVPTKLINQIRNHDMVDSNFNVKTVKDTMRPDDLLSSLSANLSSHKSEMDTRTMVTSSSKGVDSTDAHGGVYLSRAFGAYKSALESSEDEWESESIRFSNARGIATKVDNSNASVMTTLYTTVGFEQDSTFTYGELIQVFPEIDDIAQFIFPKNGEIEDATEHYEGLGGVDLEQRIAFSLGQLLPNMLFAHRIGSASFVVSNRTIDGSVKAAGISCSMLYKASVEESSHFQRMLDRIENEIIYLVLDPEVQSFEIKVNANLINGNNISIKLHRVDLQTEERKFRVPNYCNSLTSSMVSFDNQLNSLATNLNGVFDTIRDSVQSNQSLL